MGKSIKGFMEFLIILALLFVIVFMSLNIYMKIVDVQEKAVTVEKEACEHTKLIVTIKEKSYENQFFQRTYYIIATDDSNEKYVFTVSEEAYHMIGINEKWYYCEKCKLIYKITNTN